MEISAIVTAAGGIKNAIDIAKAIKSADGAIEKAEYKFKIAELIEALVDAKTSISDFRDLIDEKDSLIKSLKDALKIKDELMYEAPYYFRIIDDQKEGPYCQGCYDSKKLLIRLQSGSSQGYWKCNTCKTSFKDSSYQAPGPIRITRA